MQAVCVWKGQLCLPSAQVLNRHAHISKLRTLSLYHSASISVPQFDKLKLQPSRGLLLVSSSVEEHSQKNDAGAKVVKVKFVLQRKCEFGQQFRVIGDEELLGAWAPEAAIPMQWSEGHIWTAEQDLSVGTCMEFKIILMAEQEVIQWQPGPNQKVQLSGIPSSLVVFVPWSDEEGNLEKEPQVDTVLNEHRRTQDGVGTASSTGKLPALVEDRESEIFSNKSKEVVEEQVREERSTDNGVLVINDKDGPDYQQTEANGIVVGHQEATDARISFPSEFESSESFPPFAIPESWYGEEEQTSEIDSSHDLAESSPVSSDEIAKGKTVTSNFQSFSDKNSKENGKKLMSLNRPDEVISEKRASSMSEPIIKDENDEERRVGDVLVGVISEERASSMAEPILKKENDGEQKVRDVLVEVTSQRNVEALLSDTKLKDTGDETIEKHEMQNCSAEVTAEGRSETMISTTVSSNTDQSDKKALVNNEPNVSITEVPKIEKPSMTMDSLEIVETKPSMAAKEKKSGQTGWSKLWDAFVQGRIN